MDPNKSRGKINETFINDFANEYKPINNFLKLAKGELYVGSELVAPKDTLTVLFRGGKEQKISFYYMKNIFLELTSARQPTAKNSKANNKYTCSFNFEHANPIKYGYDLSFNSDEWLQHLIDTYKLGQKIIENKELKPFTPERKDGIMAEHFYPNLVKEIYNKIMDIMKNYLDHEPAQEFRWHHTLFSTLKNLENGIFVYDLDYQERFKNKTSKNNDTKKVNYPDLMGIRFENGNPIALTLIEVKSTESACEGSSGVEKHIESMAIPKKDIPFYYKEAKDILSCYQKCGLYGVEQKHVDLLENVDSLKIEKVLIFTNANVPNKEEDKGSLNWLENNKENLSKMIPEDDRNNWTIYKTEANYWEFDGELK